MKTKKRISVSIITPTFNREKYLTKLYKSLINQSNKQFEWIIVDDGSTDFTKNIVNNFIKSNKIDIKYYKTKNGGKHRALNYGINVANGNLIAIVDSDDYLSSKAIQFIIQYEKTIINKDNYAGLAFNKSYPNGQLVGTTFKEEYLDATNLERKKKNINGDKFEVFYLNVLKNYPFPVFENEKFLTEAVVWNRIANDGYKIRWINKTLYYCEYLDSGLSKNLFNCYRNNPNGFKLYVNETIKYKDSRFIDKIKLISLYHKIIYKKKKYKEVSFDLNTNILFVYISVLIRRIGDLFGK